MREALRLRRKRSKDNRGHNTVPKLIEARNLTGKASYHFRKARVDPQRMRHPTGHGNFRTAAAQQPIRRPDIAPARSVRFYLKGTARLSKTIYEFARHANVGRLLC